jgi:hypothetical protein
MADSDVLVRKLGEGVVALGQTIIASVNGSSADAAAGSDQTQAADGQQRSIYVRKGPNPGTSKLAQQYDALIRAFITDADLRAQLKAAVQRLRAARLGDVPEGAQVNVAQLQAQNAAMKQLGDLVQPYGVEANDLNALEVFVNRVPWDKPDQEIQQAAQDRLDNGPDWLAIA